MTASALRYFFNVAVFIPGFAGIYGFSIPIQLLLKAEEAFCYCCDLWLMDLRGGGLCGTVLSRILSRLSLIVHHMESVQSVGMWVSIH